MWNFQLKIITNLDLMLKQAIRGRTIQETPVEAKQKQNGILASNTLTANQTGDFHAQWGSFNFYFHFDFKGVR